MTTIWLLMAVTKNAFTVPALEFDNYLDCAVAVQQINKQATERGNLFRGFCVKVEIDAARGGE